MIAVKSKSNEKVKVLNVVLLKSSKYDDEGYVIRHFRGVLPSNTLACLYSLTEHVKKEGILGDDIKVEIQLLDESVHKVDVNKIARLNKRKGHKTVVCLVGVQTNQFPRATDLALQFKDAGLEVIIGGFHVSGTLALFSEITEEIKFLMDNGVTVVKGEVEDYWGAILKNVVDGELQPIYDYGKDIPDMSSQPVPMIHKRYLKRFVASNFGTIDCGRGCPFNCSFCTIINVQGRKMRSRSAETLMETIRYNYLQTGVDFYFFTDDNFARNKNWEAIFDALIKLRHEENIKIDFMIQVDVLSYKIKNFVSKAREAGCTQVFIGMETINPENLGAANKDQNVVDDYKYLIEAWHEAEVTTHVGFIIGFPFDSYESIHEDINRLKTEIKVDIASFFMLMPLPGSMDHLKMKQAGAYLDSDFNKYDSFHETTIHPRLKNGAWMKVYREAWTSFYSFENMKAILSRSHPRIYWNLMREFIWYKNSALIENGHPMVHGFFRFKDRTARRAGFEIEGRLKHYKKRFAEIKHETKEWIKLIMEMEELWLQTRNRSEAEIRLVKELQRIRGGVSRKLRLPELQLAYREACLDVPSKMRLFIEKFSIKVHGRDYTREHINRSWSEFLENLRAGRWLNISFRRLIATIWWDLKLTVNFAKEIIGKSEELRDNVYRGVRKLEAKAIAIVRVVDNIQVQNSLETFLKELGVKVVSSKKSIDDLIEESKTLLASGGHKVGEVSHQYLESVRDKADYLVMPIVKDVEKYPARISSEIGSLLDSLRSTVGNLPYTVKLPAEMNKARLKDTYTNIGLMFTDDVNKIRDACSKAIEGLDARQPMPLRVSTNTN